MIRDLVPTTQRSLSRTNNDPLIGFRRAMDSLFEDFSSDFGELVPKSWDNSLRDFSPRLDIEDKDDKIIMSAELPGLSEKDVRIEITKDLLTIKGEKKSEREEKANGRYFSERSYGSFERALRLPSEVNRDKIEAVMKEGVLKVTLPKSADAKKEVKRIPVHH